MRVNSPFLDKIAVHPDDVFVQAIDVRLVDMESDMVDCELVFGPRLRI
jgi:hypothetical protein